MKPDSILMTADVAGGVWTYSLELAAALAPHGIGVALASMGGPPSLAQLAQARAVRSVRLFASDFRLEWMDQPWDDVRRAGEWLLELENRLAPSLVHLNNFAHGDLPWSAPVLMVGHSCVLSWWETVHGGRAPAQWDEYADRVRRGLHAANVVAAPSQAMLSALRQHYGPLPNCVAIPNGRNPDLFRLAKKEPFIFAAGRLWDDAKNIASLGRIADRVSWPIVVAGPVSPGAAVPAGLRHLGQLSEPELGAVMSRASIYALPARYEPFGLSVLEAALSGCALVLGDIPSLRENWSGVAAFVNPGDDDKLLEALNSLIDDSTLRRRLGGAARERAAAFTPERMAAAYLQAYRGILASQTVEACA